MQLGLNEKDIEIFNKWVDVEKEGWPIKEGCPPEIKEWLENLLSLFDNN